MLLLALLLACPPAAPVTQTPEAPVPAVPTCIATWKRSSDASVLSEQRASGPAWRDFAEAYSSAPIDPAAHVAVKHTSSFQVDGQPVLWFTPARDAAVVADTAFGDVKVVDATSISAGEEAAVGRVLPAARTALGDRGVVQLLVEADAVLIYAHIGGEICLVEEKAEGGAYTARFTGEHVYFTNEENHDALAFEVHIAPDGAITVRG